MTETKLQRRAVIRKKGRWWTVGLHAKGQFLGNIEYTTWPHALTQALRWTRQSS